MKIMPPTYFWILSLLLIGSHFGFPIKQIVIPQYSFLGSIFILMGIGLNIWSDDLFKKEGTTVKPHELPSHLITNGPFRISRHPMYLGMAIILFGLAFFFGSLISFAYPVVFIVLIEILFIPTEERNLERTFGEAFLMYKRRVRRWL